MNRVRKIFYIVLYILIFATATFYGIYNLKERIMTEGKGIFYMIGFNDDRTQQFTKNELIKGDVIKGNLASQFNNLGTVSIRFYNSGRDSKDTIQFRIREKGTSDWMYVANYKTDQFLPHETFPIGFPTISNSKNKNYEFEIESLNGATGSGIFLDNRYPRITTKYVFSKDIVSGNTIWFVINKAKNLIYDGYFMELIVDSFIPLVLFFIVILSKNRAKALYITFYFVASVLAAIFIRNINEKTIIPIVIFWILLTLKFKLQSKVAMAFSSCYATATSIFLILNRPEIAGNTAILTFVFISISVLTSFTEKENLDNHLKYL